MSLLRVVIDTNVLVSALRSRRGWSFQLLGALFAERFEFCVSVALILEYEDVCKRMLSKLNLTPVDLDALLDYLCFQGNCVLVDFRLRPELPDPGDDLLLKVAFAGQAQYLVTFNKRHFRGIERFGITVVDPKEFLSLLDSRQ